MWDALLITPSSFYREGQGSFLSSPKSHGERGMCSLDLWTVTKIPKPKERHSQPCAQMKLVLAVRHKHVLGIKVTLLRAREPESSAWVPASSTLFSLRRGTLKGGSHSLNIKSFPGSKRLERCQALSGTLESSSEPSACAQAPHSRDQPHWNKRVLSSSTVLRGRMDCVLLS